jgi:small-conductance mechanosensitive channel
LFAWLVNRLITSWAHRTSTVVDDAVAAHLPRPLSWLIPLGALRIALPLVRLRDDVRYLVEHGLLVLIIVGLGWLVFKTVQVVEDVIVHGAKVSDDDNLHARALRTQVRAFRNIAGFIVVVVTLGFVLMSFKPVRELGAGLLASAGVAGIVIGFAAQRSLATVLAGIQIAISQPIRVDDVVIVEGEWGRIEEITLTYVVVRIWDLRRLIVPINYFIEKPFQNWTRVSADILGTVTLHLDYTVPVEELRKELERLLNASEKWDKKVWGLQVTDATERTMTVRALMSAKDAGRAWDLRCEVREKLIAFVRHRYPEALPRLRAAIDGGVRPS